MERRRFICISLCYSHYFWLHPFQLRHLLGVFHAWNSPRVSDERMSVSLGGNIQTELGSEIVARIAIAVTADTCGEKQHFPFRLLCC